MASLVDEWWAGDIVMALAVSPDGTRIATGCRNIVMIWDTHRRRLVHGPLIGHTDMIWSVAFSPDGCLVASGAWDRTIRIWDAKDSDVAIKILEGHTSYVNSVEFSPDGHLLISGGHDGTIRFWDAYTGQPAGYKIDTGSSLWSVSMSPHGVKTAAGCYDGTIKVYDVARRVLLFRCTGHTKGVRSVKFSPDGCILISASLDMSVRIWSGETGEMGNVFEGHSKAIQSVAVSPDGRYIASSGIDETVRVWDVRAGTLQAGPLSGHRSGIMGVAFTPDSTRIVSGSIDSIIKIWEIDRPIQSMGGVDEPMLMDDTGIEVELTSAQLLMEGQRLEAEITSTMSLQDVVLRLRQKGCSDMTNALDWTIGVEHPISSGGYGDIYRCKLLPGYEVAVKTLRIYDDMSEQNQKTFKHAAREIYTWSKCRHPNVQRLLGLVVIRGQIGMVATWELNGNLSQYLPQAPEADRCNLSAQIAGGLAYLHSNGVLIKLLKIHGDLKGANVLISPQGVPQLADFGNATLQEHTLQFSSTSAKAALSSRWAAPELFEGAFCSAAADVYALGMTILETITGEIPWMGVSEHAVIYNVMIKKQCHERPMKHIPSNSPDGDDLWTLLRQCWEFESQRRPTAQEVQSTMGHISKHGLVSR